MFLKLVLNLLKQLLFWVLYFSFVRIFYLLYNLSELRIDSIGFWESMASFIYGFRLDLATACYLILIPFLIILIQSFFKTKFLRLALNIYSAIILAVYTMLITTEMGIYQEWKTKMHYKALMYMSNPAEIYNTAETSQFITLWILFFCIFILSFWIYRKYFSQNISIKRNYILSLVFLIITPPFMVLGMRGGTQEIPIIQSQSYYSKHNILNLAAVNSGFNMYVSIIENYRNMGKNPFKYYSIEEVDKTLSEIYKIEKDTSLQILKTKKPNIVLIIWESCSATLIESLGGEIGVTPAYHELEKEGVLFTNLYSTGARSEQGMAAILAGFPAHPISSITIQPNKAGKLKTITHTLNSLGYYSSFYFGGQLIYGNIKSFIIHNGFDKIKEVYDFPELPKGKLGIHDEFMLNQQLTELNEQKEPFFSALFTLSTHSPYDMPMLDKKDWGYDDDINNYLNSALYTDRSLGAYFKEAKKQHWYKNTLFIIVSDHSHHSFPHDPFHSKEYHKIPMLFVGEVIKDEYKGLKWDKLGTQTDLIATLFSQMDLKKEAEYFHWSKNLLNPYAPEFANIAFEEGIGWLRPSGDFFYENRLDYYYYNNIPTQYNDSIIREGKSFLQSVFQEYMDY